MSLLVKNATRTLADQNIDNFQVILAVLEQTIFSFSSQITVTLPVIDEVFPCTCNLMLNVYSQATESTIQILDLLEEWPPQITDTATSNKYL